MSMPYLTPASLSYLTQFILVSTIAGYFWYLTRRPRHAVNDPLPTLLLAGAFTALAAAVLLLFLNDSLDPDLQFYPMALESIAVALFLVLLLQFAYRFPSAAPGQGREARIALGLTMLYALWEGGIAIQRYAMLAQGYVRYRPEVADLPLAAAFLWVAIVFLRQSVRTSAGGRPASGWRKLWRPQGRGASAARALALLSILALGLAVVGLLQSYLILPNDVTDLMQSLGMLFTLSAFALVYLNYLPETTSFMVKLVGATLATVLAMSGTTGWIVGPAYVAAYHNDSFVADRQTLRFMPNLQRGYDVSVAPFHFEGEFGTDLGYDGARLELPFDFPFFGQVWREAYISYDGAISFGRTLNPHDVQYRYDPVPAIFPLYLDLARAPAGRPGHAGLFARRAADRLTITWNQMGTARQRDTRYTFQLTLYPGGAFDITYNGLPATQTYAIEERRDAPWLIGAVPGTSDLKPQHVRLATGLPVTGGGRGGLVEDYYLHFRRYLHRLFLPLAWLIVGGTALILVAFPVFFRLNLVRPLNNLLAGVRQVNAGDLGVSMPVHYHDEIGFLTRSFNEMAAELQSRTLDLRRRAAELETLTGVSSALRQAVTVDEMVTVLIEETVGALDADAGAVMLLEDGAPAVAGVHGLPRKLLGHRPPPCDGPCWEALSTDEPILSDLVVEGTCAACELRLALGRGGSKTRVVVPLRAAQETLGVLQLGFARPDKRIDEYRQSLVAIAEMGGNAVQRARTLEMLEQLVQDRTRELLALYEVTRMTTQHLDLQTVLELVLDKSLEVIGGQAGIVHLLDETGQTLHPAARREIAVGIIDQLRARPAVGTPWDRVMELDQTVILPDEPPGVSESLPACYIGVPIRAKGQIVGVFSAFGKAGKSFSVEDIALLTGIADHIGAAVESAQLRRRAEETAVQEERRRLARDLHDSVTQSLHSLTLSADTASYLLKQRRPESVEDSLNRLGDSARQALKEMRLLLYELRLAPLEQMNLVEMLQTRLEAVEQRAGVEVRLSVDGPADWPQAWEGELYCIAMEALNNALRHARATSVTVRLQGRQDRVELEVADNGRGFDSQAGRVGGMGLYNMTERARRLGGQLTVDSAPGAGTRVRLSVEVEGTPRNYWSDGQHSSVSRR